MSTIPRALVAGAFVATLVACSGGESSSALPHCVTGPAGIGPDAVATLQTADAGATICLAPDKVLTVFLKAPVDEARWSSVQLSTSGVLRARNSGVLTLPIGVTAAVLQAVGHGVVTLRATRPPCTDAHPEASACDAAHSWHARVVVKG